jgi:hypothetical protein
VRCGIAFAFEKSAWTAVDMKLSREYNDEKEAEAREVLLKAAGYQAWRKHAPDGRWQVFWLLPVQA